MATKKKPARKRPPARKAARKPVRKTVRRKAAPAPPPTIAGVFQLISTKPGFLNKLLTDMNAALAAEHLDLPATECETLKTMLNSTYQVTGVEALRFMESWQAQRVAPPPPPWPFSIEPKSPVTF